ncbi:DUF1801 domain-containing protein [Blastococcus sp. SYSU D00669]
MTVPPEVQQLLDEHTDGVARTALELRRVLLEGHPELTERVRPGWHSLNYRHPTAGYVAGLFPLADRVRLVLERGAELPDPEGRLRGEGLRTVRYLEVVDEDDVDRELVLELVDLAVGLGRRR